MPMQVSVVVATYKRPEPLRRCLAALLAQDYDPCAYEIIVADDAACDMTRQLVEQLVAHQRDPDPAVMLAAAPVDQVWAGTAVLVAQPHTAILNAGRPSVRYVRVTGAHGPAAARNC